MDVGRSGRGTQWTADGAEMDRILRAEVADWYAAADDYERCGHGDRAARLRGEAAVRAKPCYMRGSRPIPAWGGTGQHSVITLESVTVSSTLT